MEEGVISHKLLKIFHLASFFAYQLKYALSVNPFFLPRNHYFCCLL